MARKRKTAKGKGKGKGNKKKNRKELYASEAQRKAYGQPESKKREKYPANYYLDPQNKKYPYKDPKTGKPSPKLLRSAISVANMQGDKKISEKAQRILARILGKKKKK